MVLSWSETLSRQMVSLTDSVRLMMVLLPKSPNFIYDNIYISERQCRHTLPSHPLGLDYFLSTIYNISVLRLVQQLLALDLLTQLGRFRSQQGGVPSLRLGTHSLEHGSVLESVRHNDESDLTAP